nr:MAG TPA: hypothetical protein [Caudoviricetes sp.]DAP83561.1 MAG TPA: hypothetical protein [Caudoviricetes sp.]
MKNFSEIPTFGGNFWNPRFICVFCIVPFITSILEL